MANEEIVAYSQPLQKLRDIQTGFEYARLEASEEGREKGLRGGRAEGRKDGRGAEKRNCENLRHQHIRSKPNS